MGITLLYHFAKNCLDFSHTICEGRGKGIMHVDKFARTAVGHMLKHYSRDAAHFGNEQIDRSRSCFNYNLAPDREKADIGYYKERLSKVKCQKRADVKTL